MNYYITKGHNDKMGTIYKITKTVFSSKEKLVVMSQQIM